MHRFIVILPLALALPFLLSSTGCGHHAFEHALHDTHDVHDAHGRGSYYHDAHTDPHRYGAQPPPPPTYVPAGYGPRGLWVWDPRRGQYYWSVY